MKNIVAEIDKIAKYIEDFDEPWAINIVWRLDKISQTIEELNSKGAKFSSISNNVLNQYRDKLIFLSENDSRLTDLIKNSSSKNVKAIYSVLKKEFGEIDKKDSMDYIKNVLKRNEN